MAKIATLTEIRQQWTLTDLLDAHEALDVHAEMELEQARRHRR